MEAEHDSTSLYKQGLMRTQALIYSEGTGFGD